MTTPPTEGLTPAKAEACRDRRRRLGAAVQDAGADALLVAHPTDIRYLTGFVGDDSLLLAHGDDAVIITDARHDELLDPWRKLGAAEVVMGTRHRLERSAREVCEARRIRRLALQAEHVTLAARGRLEAALESQALVETEGLVERLRMRKDELEIAAIEQALVIQQEAMRAMLQRLAVGRPEREISALLEYEMKVRGASGPSFPTMIAAGTRSSVIHYQPSREPVEEGALLADWGAVWDGYCSDLTRTFGVAALPSKIGEIYAIVLEAQQAAIEAVRPGRPCAEIDGVARQIIDAAGYGEHFGHGLGHGLGLDIHEAPYFNQLSTDVLLEPGMVMTVEPGIYLPGIGGVRIEDDVLVTDDGCRVLSDFPKGIDAAVVEPAGAVAAAGASGPAREARHA